MAWIVSQSKPSQLNQIGLTNPFNTILSDDINPMNTNWAGMGSYSFCKNVINGLVIYVFASLGIGRSYVIDLRLIYILCATSDYD